MKERSTGMHQSTYYLPLIRSYQDALLRLRKTKPIRGRTPTNHKWGHKVNPCVPLGRREDIDTYSIREGEGGDIELVNYGRVVLTYKPDNKILVTPTWMGLMESGMIARVLGINAWLDRKKIGLTIDDERHVVGAGGVLVLECKGDADNESLSVFKKDTIFSYYVNRKASNIVRAQYSGFSQYLHGFLQLRKDMETNAISISMVEIADCIGYEYSEQPVWSNGATHSREKQWKPSTSNFRFINDKPQGVYCLQKYELGVGNKQLVAGHIQRHWTVYENQTKAFIELVVNGQPDGTRTDNYYRATLTLLALSFGYTRRNPKEGEDMSVIIPVSRVEKLWDDVVLKYHSDEMIEKRPLKPNQLPNEKYNRYVTIMPTQEQIDTVMKREANL
jgi:hypothetical protein